MSKSVNNILPPISVSSFEQFVTPPKNPHKEQLRQRYLQIEDLIDKAIFESGQIPKELSKASYDAYLDFRIGKENASPRNQSLFDWFRSILNF